MGSLLTALFDFKRDFDRNAPLAEVLPGVVEAASDRYRSLGLADLAAAMHATLRETGQMSAQASAFSRLPRQSMVNADAYAHVVRGTIEPTRLAELAGRTVSVGVVPYPPGIPLLMPGENAGADDEPFIGYLRALEEFDRRFPGFEHDLHGVEHEAGEYVISSVKEEPRGAPPRCQATPPHPSPRPIRRPRSAALARCTSVYSRWR